MKPTDLRIGNLLLQGVVDSISNTNAYCYVPKKGQSIFQKISTGQYYTYDKLTPILLTEDILLNFGFESIEDGWFRHVKTQMSFTWNIYDKELRLMSYTLPHIDYVHQLQNLYFALTGRELE